MAKLILVHQVSSGEELVLNSDQIVHARNAKGRDGDYSTVKMASGDSHAIRESIIDLIGLSD